MVGEPVSFVLFVLGVIGWRIFFFIVSFKGCYFIRWQIWILPFASNKFSFHIDENSLIFRVILSFVALHAYKYRGDYFNDTRQLFYFYRVLLVFTARIQLLIFAGDWFLVFLSWDGLGIRSFLLVCFYDKVGRRSGSLLTVFTNRLGDVLLCVGVRCIIYVTNSSQLCSGQIIGWVTCAFILAAFTKRAQWPTCAWLPAAMAAPTPISALVHSSTLVTAGIYLLVQGEAMCGITYIGVSVAGFTFFIAAFGAAFTYDIKRLIAISTLGHLGFIFFCFFTGNRHICIYHLWVHALFKRVLFLCAGNYIMRAGHSQDLRDIGQIWVAQPVRGVCCVIRLFRLAGIPISRSFFSKGAGISIGFIYCENMVVFCIWGAIVLSCYYCIRFTILTMGGCAFIIYIRKDRGGNFSSPAMMILFTFVGCWLIRFFRFVTKIYHRERLFSGFEIIFFLLGGGVCLGITYKYIFDFIYTHFLGVLSFYHIFVSAGSIIILGQLVKWEHGRFEGGIPQLMGNIPINLAPAKIKWYGSSSW